MWIVECEAWRRRRPTTVSRLSSSSRGGRWRVSRKRGRRTLPRLGWGRCQGEGDRDFVGLGGRVILGAMRVGMAPAEVVLLVLLDERLHLAGVGVQVAVTDDGVGAARALDDDVRPEQAGVNLDRGDLGDVDGFFLGADRLLLMAYDLRRLDGDLGREEQVVLGPAAGEEDGDSAREGSAPSVGRGDSDQREGEEEEETDESKDGAEICQAPDAQKGPENDVEEVHGGTAFLGVNTGFSVCGSGRPVLRVGAIAELEGPDGRLARAQCCRLYGMTHETASLWALVSLRTELGDPPADRRGDGGHPIPGLLEPEPRG